MIFRTLFFNPCGTFFSLALPLINPFMRAVPRCIESGRHKASERNARARAGGGTGVEAAWSLTGPQESSRSKSFGKRWEFLV